MFTNFGASFPIQASIIVVFGYAAPALVYSSCHPIGFLPIEII